MRSSSAHPVAPLTDAFAFLVIAAVATGLPVAAHLAGPVAGALVAAVMAVLVAALLPAAVPATLVGSYVFQNLFVSIASPWIADAAQYNAIRGTNFVLTAVMWSVLAAQAVAGWSGLDATVRRFLVWSSAGLVLVFGYFGLGLLADPKNAIVYLRNIATPLIVLQICILAAGRSPPGLLRSLLPIGVVVVAYGYAELFARGALFDIINADTAMAFRMQEGTDAGIYLKQMRETGRVIRGFEDTMTGDLFNTPLLADLKLQFYRLMGPNFHPISYSYSLCLFGLLFVVTRHPFLAAAALPPMLFSGSKGALVTFAFALAASWAAKRVSGPLVMACFVALLSIALALAVVIGLSLGDYHVIGLLGGLKGALQQPFGHGLGVGGNLSFNMATIDWSRSQALGETDRAVESAVGVLLYQMGVAGAALCALYVGLGIAAWRLSDRGRRPIPAMLAFAILSITANGVLQEEALFAPLAMATCLALAGIVFGEAQAHRARAGALARRTRSGRVRRASAPVGSAGRGMTGAVQGL